MFNPSSLFGHVVCPRGDACALQPNCIFGLHPPLRGSSQASPPAAESPASSLRPKQQTQPAQAVGEPQAKRRKVTYDSLADKPPSRADQIIGQIANDRQTPAAASRDTAREPQPKPQAALPKSKLPPSLRKLVSPPPTTGKAISTSDPATAADKVGSIASPAPSNDDAKIESLNPRLVENVHCKHSTRLLLLKLLHAEMVRLNQKVGETDGLPFKHLIHFTEQRLVKLALDEEETLAKAHGAVYNNKIKHRIAALKKMPLDDWVQELKVKFGKDKPKQPKNTEKPIVTGLPMEQEALILPQLVVDQRPLAAHGYVTIPPTEEAAQEAAAAVAASQNYEECDRCGRRFQVFPDRNEDGLLCGNGPCRFHPLRKQFPQRAKTDRETGAKEAFHPCCMEKVGSNGCHVNEQHVFKTSSPARLASVLPFVNTPENATPAKDAQGREVQAVTFDCEMGYTVNGLELIRMTAVAWPTGEQLVDVLVRPLGAIIDLNSRFSGVFAEDFANAIPFADWKDHVPPPPSDNGRPRLPVVDGPAKARELLCSFLKPTTPLIGHAIDNDLNTVRLCHPTIIDTVVLFPHPRGLPMRFGLKMLSARHLNRHIQTGGSQGHDSKEDAIATGDLVRVKVRDKWKELRIMGWQIVDGKQLTPPAPRGKSDSKEPSTSADQSAQALLDRRLNGSSRKRKRKQKVSTGGAESESTESSEATSPTDTSTDAA